MTHAFQPPDVDVIEAQPSSGGWVQRRAGLVVVGLCVLGCLALWRLVLTGGEGEPADCRQRGDVEYCSTPARSTTDARVVRLVHGYCPKLATLRVEDVLPLPLSLGGITSRRGDLVLRTTQQGVVVESALLGHPGRIAWVFRTLTDGRDDGRDGGKDGGRDGGLQIVCQESSNEAPALELDRDQLAAAVAADEAGRGLDLRLVAREAARRLAGAGSQVSLGTFRCRTRPPVLALEAGSRFTCSLALYSTTGRALVRTRYAVSSAPPYFREVS